ncbi:glycoside hydrolase family 99-like domain-containing protein [Gammaproteobacteria bacterium]|nr:glycoside hydrolase family 99-like domain-containing protein [Gammaproteobacteria bacterium]
MPKLIAFYLPQFHPIPENDKNWGKGFTEWTNVTKASPLYEGHYQPHLPADLGFYDLRVKQTRHDQIKLAQQFGIDGFCYHYYWFSGKRVLHKPLDDMLADPESDMPFCVCWANENWTRRWDASDHELILEQKYLPEDNLNFIKDLIPTLQDSRYIKIDNKPFLIVYCPQHIPDACKTFEVWREYCREKGLGEIHICGALTHGNDDYEKFGLDSGVEFPPHNAGEGFMNHEIQFFDTFKGTALQYAKVARSFLNKSYKGDQVFKTVFPSWDNTARTKERAVFMFNSTPENYEYWLSSTIDLVQSKQQSDSPIFINAWNEWAEGCHLEPDQRHGHAFLQATLNAKNGERKYSDFPHMQSYMEAMAYEVNSRRFWKDIWQLNIYHFWLNFGKLKRMINCRSWLRTPLLPIVRFTRKLLSLFN